MYIDTHAHLDNDEYDDIDRVINDAKRNKVENLIVSCCSKKSIIEGLNLINKYNNIFLTIGFHPDQVDDIKIEDIIWLKKVILSTNKIVGIGEIGLDYHYEKENSQRQIEVFKSQMDLASKLNMPVVIHSRDATFDTLEIIKNYDVRGIIHCFSGSLEIAKEYIKKGYLLGIGGILTFKNSKLQNVIKEIDLKNIVLETDSPYLSPEPYRGEQNGPKNIPIIAEKLSDIKKININLVENITTNNALRLFDLEH